VATAQANKAVAEARTILAASNFISPIFICVK
jgi:hypothetical protein